MDLLSLGFLFLILVVSGGIAYLADKLGKKLGKKRLSLRAGRYSMRPKHVAALGTVVMGVAVSFSTILFIALVSRDAREWLVEGRQLLVQLGERKREVRNLEGQKVELVRQNDLLKRQLDRLKGESEMRRKEVAALNDRVKDLNGRLDQNRAELAKSRNALDENQKALARNQRLLRTSRNQVLVAQAKVAQANAELAKTEASLVQVRKDYGVAKSSLTYFKKLKEDAVVKSLQTYSDLKKVEAQVEALKKDIEDREAVAETLRSQTADLIKERDRAEDAASDAQVRYAALQTKLEQAGAELARIQGIAQKQYLFITTTFNSSRLEPMTYRAGEEVARWPLAGGSDEDAAANALASLLRSARLSATARGAKPSKRDGKTWYEVADVFGHNDETTGAPVSGDDLKRIVVARAAGKLEDQVLIATSTLNAFAGEPVSLDLSVVPNPMVYRRNELVAEGRIDGSLDEDGILEQITEFLSSRVREKALQNRMIPRSGTDAPFGQVKTGDVLAIVRDVKRVGRSVLVRAFAGSDTRAADPLRLEFRLR